MANPPPPPPPPPPTTTTTTTTTTTNPKKTSTASSPAASAQLRTRSAAFERSLSQAKDGKDEKAVAALLSMKPAATKKQTGKRKASKSPSAAKKPAAKKTKTEPDPWKQLGMKPADLAVFIKNFNGMSKEELEKAAERKKEKAEAKKQRREERKAAKKQMSLTGTESGKNTNLLLDTTIDPKERQVFFEMTACKGDIMAWLKEQAEKDGEAASLLEKVVVLNKKTKAKVFRYHVRKYFEKTSGCPPWKTNEKPAAKDADDKKDVVDDASKSVN